MNQALVCQGITALYLIVGGTVMDADSNLASKIIFKTVPMTLGIWMWFNVVAQYKGWPV